MKESEAIIVFSEKKKQQWATALLKRGNRFENEYIKKQNFPREYEVILIKEIREAYKATFDLWTSAGLVITDEAGFIEAIHLCEQEFRIKVETQQAKMKEIISTSVIKRAGKKVSGSTGKDLRGATFKEIIKPELWDDLILLLHNNSIINKESLLPYLKYNKPGMLCSLIKKLHVNGYTIPDFNGKANPGCDIIKKSFKVKPNHITYRDASLNWIPDI